MDYVDPATQILNEMEAVRSELPSSVLPVQGTVGVYTVANNGYGSKTETWPSDGESYNFLVAENTPAQPTLVGEKIMQPGDTIIIKTERTLHLKQRDRITIATIVYEVESMDSAGTLGFVNVALCTVVTGAVDGR